MTQRPWSRIAVFGVGFVVVAWIGVTAILYFLHQKDSAKAGPAGDMFGAVNALFTGLAFLGVLIQMSLQQEQIAENKVETQRLLEEERQTKEAFNKATYATSYRTARDILQEERVRAARKTVITVLSALPHREWSDEQRAAAELVCSTYDTVAIMVSLGLLPVHYIADHWGDALRKCWAALEAFVRDWRVERGSMEVWDDFEWLVTQSHQFHRKVPSKDEKAA